jgi:hypothetical protein
MLCLDDRLRWKLTGGSHSQELGLVPSLVQVTIVGWITRDRAGPLGGKWRPSVGKVEE